MIATLLSYRRAVQLLMALFALSLISACASKGPPPLKPSDKFFEEGKSALDKRRWLEAVENFQRLISNYPGSAQVADAQYYLAEAYFGMEDHVNAVYEYQRVFDLYPHSQWADEAQFKIGESWFEQRRRPELDQTETHEALLAYRRFIEDNPDSPHVDTARERIAQCRNRLAKKDYLSARLYLRQDHLEAARMSFEQMVRAYPDTDWYLWGISKLGEVDCRQGDRHSAHSRWNEVLELSDDEQLRERVQERLAETDCFD